MVNRKVLVNDKNQIVQVLQEGRRGLGTVNPSDSAERIRQALLNNQNLDVNLNIQEVDFTEERLSVKGLKWIEVNLSKQTTTLYTGDQPVHSFLISSGVHPWPTPTGTFKVWLRFNVCGAVPEKLVIIMICQMCAGILILTEILVFIRPIGTIILGDR